MTIGIEDADNGSGGLAAETARLVSQSRLGRIRARGLALGPLFPTEESGDSLARRTSLLLAGSALHRRKGCHSDAA